jgi:hypothetical protein
LSSELSQGPHYSRYSIYFTNSILESQVRQLSRSDKYGLVSRVEEIYLDFFPHHRRLFSLNFRTIVEVRLGQSEIVVSRIADGISSALSALDLRPMIRYWGMSTGAQSIARSVFERISRSPSSGSEGSLLLILDRLSDPFTALVRPWFYIGALHDLFNIRNNLISTRGLGEPFVICERQDRFIRVEGCSFLSEVGPAVSREMSELRSLNERAQGRIEKATEIAEVVRAAGAFQEGFARMTHHTTMIGLMNEVIESERQIEI